MPATGDDSKEKNLYKDITQDIDPAVMKVKQAEFDALQDEIDRVFKGDIGNFYADDFPNAIFDGEGAEAEL